MKKPHYYNIAFCILAYKIYIGINSSQRGKAASMNNILLIHLGGLGDMCLSESVFLSLQRHFGNNINALGYIRFLILFRDYFAGIKSIDSRHWLHLFSKEPSDIRYKRIIFIGKDTGGILRERWQAISEDNLIFIDMYPDEASNNHQDYNRVMHIEDYQLIQLKRYGIEAYKKDIIPIKSDRIVLYPEKGFSKEKWGHENFVDLYHSLKNKGLNVIILEQNDSFIDIDEKVSFEQLTDVMDFLKNGGIFVSNDSGMAHLAGMCGMYTLTIFHDFNPILWHPRGINESIKYYENMINVPYIESKIIEIRNSLFDGAKMIL